jgi:hypothetical protein
LDANFNIFLPVKSNQEKVPVLVWLSGLTCTEDNGCVSSAILLLVAYTMIERKKGLSSGTPRPMALHFSFPIPLLAELE